MNENGSRTGEPQGESSPTFDRQFYRALGSRERRRLLSVLLDRRERSVEEVATLLVGWDATASGSIEGPEARERTLVRLHHVHLPMLDDAGLVVHDADDGTVRLAPLDPETVEYVERSLDVEDVGRA